MVRILFEQKKPGRTRQTIEPVEVELGSMPETVGELIEATVRSCVDDFNRKALAAPENPDADGSHKLLDQQTIEGLAETGRVAFGIVYNGKTANAEEAVETALQCYDDGLFRIFLNGHELKEADERIKINDGDRLTVVRLTLLAGRLW